jgi:uncharacterized protein
VSAENVEITQQAYEAFNRGGVDAILDFLSEDIEWHMWEQFARGQRVFRGHDGVREVLGIFTENYDDFRAEPEEFLDAGDTVLVPVRLIGRVRGTGDEERFDLVQVWSARDGLAYRLDVYTDRTEALRATGYVPD